MRGALVCVVGAVTACGGARLSDGFGPATVVTLETSHGAAPMFVVDADGTTTLSWVAAPGGGTVGELHVVVADATGDTSRSVLRDRLGGIEPLGESPPQIARSRAGELYAAYIVGKDIGQRHPASALRFARSVDGGRSWSAPISINEGREFGSHSFHAIAAGEGKVVYVSWLNHMPGEEGVWVRRSDDGGRTWAPAVRAVVGASCPCCRTAVVAAREGEAYLAWRSVTGDNIRDIAVTRTVDRGVTWSPMMHPRADQWKFSACPVAGPSLHRDAEGVLHLAWWTGAPGAAGVWYARSTDGGAEWSAVPIDTAAVATHAAHVQIALNDSLVVIAWDGGSGPLPVVYLRASVDGGASFGPTRSISDPRVAATYPVLGLTRDSVVVAWSELGSQAYRDHLDYSREPEAPGERMALPRVGQQEIVRRSGPLRALLP